MKVTGSPLLPGLLLLAALIVLLGLSHGHGGAATSSDSLTYFNVAKSIAAGRGVLAPDYQLGSDAFAPITLWPPLYPALLSTLCVDTPCTAAGVRALTVYLNLLLELLAALVFLVLAGKLVGKWLALAATAGLLLLPAIQITYMFVWSEAVFIPLILLSFYFADRYFEQACGNRPDSVRAWPMLLLAIVVVAVASYTRYVGVAFAIALLLSLFIFGSGAIPRRLKAVVWSGLLYSVLISPLLLSNLSRSGHLSGGERGAPTFRLFEDCIALYRLVVQELFGAQWLLLSVWLLVVLALVSLRYYQARAVTCGARAAEAGEGAGRLLPMAVLWSLCYLAFLLISRSVQQVDLDTRMLVVILPFMLLALLALTRYLSAYLPLGVSALPLVTVLVISGISGLACHQTLLKNLRDEHSPGYVHHMRYFSITEPRFAIFGELAGSFVPAGESLLLTDIPRPQILSYFFSEARIKLIPQVGQEVDFEQVDAFLLPGARAIIYSPDVQGEFLAHFGDNPSVAELTWVDHPGGRYLLARFP